MADYRTTVENYFDYIVGFSHSSLKCDGEDRCITAMHSKGFEVKVIPTVYIDRDFQRNFVWNRARRRAYNKAVMNKKSGTPITIACIESCLTYAKSVACELSVLKFEELLELGYKYISLDGQNRSLTMQEFIEKGTGLTMGDTVYDCSITGESHDLSNCLLKDFEPTVRQQFLTGTKVPVTVYTGYTYPELAAEFRDLNSSDNLNPMEWRNSYQTWFAGWIREQASKHSDLFKSCMSKGEYEKISNRMTDRELYSIYSLYLGGVFKSNMNDSVFDARTCNIKKKFILDRLYECGESITQHDTRFPYDMSACNRVDKIVGNLTMAAPELKKLGSGSRLLKWQVWAFLSVFEWIHDKGHTIKNADIPQFVQLVDTVLKKARHDSRQQQSIDEKAKGDDLPKQQYFYGQLETIAEKGSRDGIKSTIDDLMTTNLNQLPVQLSSQSLPLEVDFTYEDEFTY